MVSRNRSARVAVRQSTRRPERTRLTIEPLEDRALPALFTVVSTLDDGTPGTFRWAITQANSAPGADTIDFLIPAAGVQSIALLSALPPITGPVTIDGTTQIGYSGAPLIQIDGTLAGAVDGLSLAGGSGGTTIQGLAVSNFNTTGSAGIQVASDNNVIQGNWIGTDAAGTAAAANDSGVRLTAGARGNTVGGSTPAARNVISGNTTAGVEVSGTKSYDNTIQGNYIGTDVTGTAALGNGQAGVLSSDTAGTIIRDNVISGNGTNVELSGNGAIPDTVFWLRGEGDATDATSTADGVLQNGTTFGNGVSGQAFALDGVSNYVRVPYTSAMDYSVGATFEAWINPETLPPTGTYPDWWEVFNQNVVNGEPGGDIFGLRLYPDGHMQGGAHTTGGSWWQDVVSPAGAIVPGRFTHVALTMDQATHEFSIYVNGAKTTNVLTDPMATSNTDVKIGVDLYNSAYFKGRIDEPALYTRALTVAEISTIVAGGGPAKGKNVVAGNLIGLDATGTAALGATGSGLVLTNSASGNLVGDPTASAPNAISGNGIGITVDATAGPGNALLNNWVGTAAGGTGSVPNPGGALKIAAGATVKAAGTITGDILDAGTLDLAGNSVSVRGGLTGSGIVTNSAASGTATLTLNGTGTFDGVIQNGATAGTALTVAGGTITLTGTSTYTGATTINGGTLRVNGLIPTGSPVQVETGANLSGNGTVRGLVLVKAGGTVTAGNGPGRLRTGALSLRSDAHFVAELNGTTVGTEYDQALVTGTVNLNADAGTGAVLDVVLGYLPIKDDTFTILDNDGTTDAVIGKFKGLVEGDVLAIGPNRFKISYVGGDGNDITLTTLDDATTVTLQQAVAAEPQAGTGVLFDVVFSEPVLNFTAADIDLTGTTSPGTLVKSISGSGPAYTVTITGMTGGGTITASIPAAAGNPVDGYLTNLAGVANQASTTGTTATTDNTVTYVHSGTVQFTAHAISETEHNGSIVTFTVTRTDGTEGPLDIDYTIVPGATNPATTGADYTPPAGPLHLHWDAGDMSDRTFDIQIFDDQLFEGDETVDLQLVNPSIVGALGTVPSSVLTIKDYEEGTFAFATPNFKASEGGSASIVVTRTLGTNGPASVDYSLVLGSAEASDIGTPSIPLGTINFGSGDTSKTIDVPINVDALSEGYETVAFTLSNSRPTGGAILGAMNSAILTIDPSNPIVLNAGNKFTTKLPDTDQDLISVKLTGSKVGTLNVYLTDVPVANPVGPISLLELVGTDPAKAALAVTVTKASPKVNPAADGKSILSGVTGPGLSSLRAPKYDLDGTNGPGIAIGGFLGAVSLANVQNGADIHTGASPDPRKATSITLGTVADGTDIVVAGPIKTLSAISVGKGSILAPSIGSITVKGKAKTKTAAAIPGDFGSSLTIAGTGLAPKVPALKSFNVAGAVSGSNIRVGVGGTIGDVGSVSVGSFIDSTLFAGYDGPTDGSVPFNLPSTMKSFTVTGKTNAFARSFVIATNFNTVLLASVDPAPSPTQFGFLYQGLLKSLSVLSTKFKFNPKGPVEQYMPSSDFYVKKV